MTPGRWGGIVSEEELHKAYTNFIANHRAVVEKSEAEIVRLEEAIEAHKEVIRAYEARDKAGFIVKQPSTPTDEKPHSD